MPVGLVTVPLIGCPGAYIHPLALRAAEIGTETFVDLSSNEILKIFRVLEGDTLSSDGRFQISALLTREMNPGDLIVLGSVISQVTAFASEATHSLQVVQPLIDRPT